MGTFEKLYFVRRMEVSAIYRHYEVSRSKNPDCGVLHRRVIRETGGEVSWITSGNFPVLTKPLCIPINIPDWGGRSGGTQERYVTSDTEQVAGACTVDYPGVFIAGEPFDISVQQQFLQTKAAARSLRGNTTVYLSATVVYDTNEVTASDAFTVYFYYAHNQYIRIPTQWVPISPAGEQKLVYDRLAPNTTGAPRDTQFLKWDVPAEGYLLARISDVSGNENPIPTPTGGLMLDGAWFAQQRNWAFLKIQ